MTTTEKLPEALRMAIDRIRRASWDKGFYWYRHGQEFWQFNPDEPTYPTREDKLTGDVSIEDAAATDWEEA